jgi:hypothetical protein
MELRDNPIIDGFSLNMAIRYLPYVWEAHALAQMEILRRANLFRPRWHVLPDQQNTPIAAYDTYEFQAGVLAGSYLWGIQFTQFDGSVEEPTTYTPVAPSDSLIQVTEACTGIALFQDFVAGGGFSFFRTTGRPRGEAVPYLLSRPRIIMEPGLVNVEIHNRSAVPLTCQLILFFAEPCVVVKQD